MNLYLVAEGGARRRRDDRWGAPAGLPTAVSASDCGQYLTLTCGGELIALIGAMGSDVETVEFADGSRYGVEELMDRVAG
ncbi:MAG: hypothetical protein IPL72_16695 [Sulfuritalea sp.]|nr:hypothetical protein [Sulfuritalea sp.]